MHELGVTFHIMDHLEKVAKENEVEKIRKVVLELGEVSTVIESYLQNCCPVRRGTGRRKRQNRRQYRRKGQNLLWRHFLQLHTVRNVRRPIRP